MKRFTVLLKTQTGYQDRGGFDTIEEAINHLSTVWLEDWVKGNIFIVENIPVKLTVG